MQPTTPPAPVSKVAFWTGLTLSILPSLMLGFSAVMKFVQPPDAAKGFEHLGVPMSQATGLGVLEVACTLIYLIPRTAVLGAILLTGYLGGAIQTHLRVGDPYWVQIVLGILLWGGVWLRDPRLRALLPLRN